MPELEGSGSMAQVTCWFGTIFEPMSESPEIRWTGTEESEQLTGCREWNEEGRFIELGSIEKIGFVPVEILKRRNHFSHRKNSVVTAPFIGEIGSFLSDIFKRIWK